VLGILVAGGSFRFDFAIPIADDAAEAVHLLALSVILALATSVAFGLVLMVWGGELAAALGAATLTPYLWLLPIALFVATVGQALASWAVYHRAFPALGRMRAIQGAALASSQVGLGLVHLGPVGLMLGDLAGRILGTEQLFRSLFAALRSTALSLRALGDHARRRWGFARVMTAASVLSALSIQIPFLLIPAFFDLASAGQFFLAYRMIVLPASLVAAAVSQVFFGEASHRRADPRKLRDLAKNAAISLLVFSIPTYAIVAISGRVLIPTVFGAQWELAGTYAQILAPSLIVWSVASPISTLLLVGRRELESLFFTAAELVLKAGSLVFGSVLHSLTAGIVALSIVSVFIEVAALWRFLRVASVSLNELARPAARIFILTVPSLCLVAAVGAAAPSGLPIAAAIGWAVALGLAARFSPEPRALLSGSYD
jgi:O-antigen/teichoic acid export membrane protein